MQPIFGVPAIPHDLVDLPASSYDPEQRRYSATQILKSLAQMKSSLSQMGRVLVATTKSILKGFNLFYTQYGFMSEGMDNAEVRLQMAGRLRPLFPHHLKEIERIEKVLMEVKPASPVIRHLRRLKTNVKIFDVVSPRMISGFPDIQNGKAFMLNTFLFSQIHQRSFPEIFTDEEVFHYIDSRPTFNAKTVESFCKKAIEEALERYVGELEGIERVAVPALIELMGREIQSVRGCRATILCWSGRTCWEDRIRIAKFQEKCVGIIKKRDPPWCGVSFMFFGGTWSMDTGVGFFFFCQDTRSCGGYPSTTMHKFYAKR